jgi:hypothetical protein
VDATERPDAARSGASPSLLDDMGELVREQPLFARRRLTAIPSTEDDLRTDHVRGRPEPASRSSGHVVAVDP